MILNNVEMIDRITKLSAQKQQLLLMRLNNDKIYDSQQHNKFTLTAFVIPKSGQIVSSSNLKLSLRKMLPDYMIPVSYVELQAFPQLSNGKIDVNKLSLMTKNIEPKEFKPTANTDIETKLIAIWRKLLQADYINVDDDFFEMGGDSILSIQVVSLARQSGFTLSPNDLFDYPTIELLAAKIHSREINNQTHDERHSTNSTTSGRISLIPIQHWFFNQKIVNQAHWNQNLLLEIDQVISEEMLKSALALLTEQHDALRSCFNHDSDGWYQQIEEQVNVNLTTVRIAEHDNVDNIIRDVTTTIQSEFSLNVAPLYKFIFFDCAGENINRLFICAHHLVIDSVSWRIIVADLERICEQMKRGEEVDFPSKRSSFMQWSQALEKLARNEKLQLEKKYWQSLPLNNTCRVPTEHVGDDTCEGNSTTITVMLDKTNSSALINDVNTAYQTTILEILLTTLSQVLESWTGRSCNTIGLEGHGRESVIGNEDISETIGWLTTLYPVCLERSSQQSTATDIKHIKEIFQSIPNKGIGYGLLKYMNNVTNDQNIFNDEDEPDVIFNYLGIMNQKSTSTLFKILPFNCEQQRDEQNKRLTLLDINCSISSGQLEINWTYDQSKIKTQTINRLANEFIKSLKVLIEHCLDSENSGYTPSDFPDAGLNQDELDSFINSLY